MRGRICGRIIRQKKKKNIKVFSNSWIIMKGDLREGEVVGWQGQFNNRFIRGLSYLNLNYQQ